MTPNRVTVAMEKYGAHIPKEVHSSFRASLERADDRCMDEFMFLPYKKKGVALLMSLMLGGYGADRFYIGDTKLGILKLASTICAYLLTIKSNGAFSSLLMVAVAIWCVADIFVCYKKSSRSNYEKLTRYLTAHPYRVIPAGSTSSTGGAGSKGYSSAAASAKPSTSSASSKKSAAASESASPKQPEKNDDFGKYAPVKDTSKDTEKNGAKGAKPTVKATGDIEAARAAALAADAARISAGYDTAGEPEKPAPKTAAKASSSKASAPSEPEKPAAPAREVLDLTFSNVRVDASLAKELGFEDFDEQAFKGGVKNGR